MKKIFLLAFTCLLTVSLLAQDKVINDANAEARNVSGFHGIKVSHGIALVIKQGNTEAVAVSASTKEYRDHIKTEVVNGIVKIYYDNEKWYKGWSSNGKKLRAYVSFKQLDLVDGSSGSSTTIDGTMNAGDLKINLSSGADFRGTVQSNSLNVDESSGATAHISGKSQSVSVETSSGAGFYGFELVSDKCDADASSGGSIEISVNKELSADASSGGDIRYKGAGVITKISTSSGGSVKSSR
jgi:Putative auto-transporter adhesin, head GIN domain